MSVNLDAALLLTDGGLGVDKSLAIDKGDLKQRSCCARYFSDEIQPPPLQILSGQSR
ncbi:MAG TPA: hypothetical protein V6D26_12710 [Stenomitos sp.]